ncbi:MAG: hypothetical protein NVS4B3_27550 [Gemmatimonadaceae bacterium]
MPKRKVEVFSAGCPVCDETVETVKSMICEDCDPHVRDMRKVEAQAAAKRYGVKRLPAVVVNGKLADCCGVGSVIPSTLRALGVGVRA